MTDELKRLREIAEKATPGEWRWLNCCTLVADHGNRPVVLASNDFLEVRDRETGMLKLASVDGPDEAFIAAANPAVVLRLLDRVQMLEDSIGLAISKLEQYHETYLDYDRPEMTAVPMEDDLLGIKYHLEGTLMIDAELDAEKEGGV